MVLKTVLVVLFFIVVFAWLCVLIGFPIYKKRKHLDLFDDGRYPICLNLLNIIMCAIALVIQIVWRR